MLEDKICTIDSQVDDIEDLLLSACDNLETIESLIDPIFIKLAAIDDDLDGLHIEVNDVNGCGNLETVIIEPPLGLTSAVTALPSCLTDDGEITVGKVAKPLVTENCTTQCYKAALADLQIKNLASGSYTKEDDAVIVEITDSSDEVNFPKCQVRWNIIDQIDEDHQQWQLENVDCSTPIFDFTTWVKKVK